MGVTVIPPGSPVNARAGGFAGRAARGGRGITFNKQPRRRLPFWRAHLYCWSGLSVLPRTCYEMPEPTSDSLRLTDFLDLPTLQEIQDSFAAVADVRAVITDADGNLLTQPTPTTGFLRRQRALAAEGEQR